ncbi:hypothetical protein CGCF415_v000573 [Colletotrichum fructicola]|nr:hypothetical protein CGCF415_v000573 [Colletotrichum fructicola]KAF4940323.1 hypothetical protein CGCF245_v002735 [Colletotrichum fructicola]KAF5496720.1 hypothetical protein CGCF413_v008562 [Colletotrichum fructicola]KAI8285074.1 hypothetical protein K4K60_001433 [Colletotrichum sp. SAR11_57]
MDESPLVKAHDHAKAASNATHQSETTVAINEHALAAGEFANAARSTASLEALRTLRLLEQHHKHLSELLKIPLDRRTSQASNIDTIDGKAESQASETTSISASDDAPTKSETAGSPAATAKHPPSLTQPRRYPSREMTSSIASNLASARGIRGGRNRSQPIPPSVTNDQAPGNMEGQARREGSRAKMQNVLDQSGKPAWIPPTHAEPQRQEPKKTEEVASPASDDGYSRFYNTFGSIINRLSAPLAFAGLPLISEESPAPEPVEVPEPAPVKRNRLKSPATTAEPDLSKIYSRNTLRALSANNPNDSFYVVPTSGHTVSYANILNFADKEKRRMEASLHGVGSLIEDDEDDFVDARETPSAPVSPGAKRRGGRTRSERDRAEEHRLENEWLKDTLDKLSKRLHAFEASAQSSSMALAESMRLRPPASPSGLGGAGSGAGDAVLRARNKDLEEQLALAIERMEALEKENKTMARTLEKYRDKWDKLKAGAKARRQAQGSAEVAAQEAEETGGS